MSNSRAIEQFIKEEIMLGSGPERIDPSESMLDSGVLDSLALLRLIGFLEEQFGVAIDDDEVLPENFESIDSIQAFLAGKGK
jgi:acyl carrier protein